MVACLPPPVIVPRKRRGLPAPTEKAVDNDHCQAARPRFAPRQRNPSAPRFLLGSGQVPCQGGSSAPTRLSRRIRLPPQQVLRGPTTTVVHEVEGGHNDMNDAVQIQTLLLGTGQAGGTPVEDAQTGARQRKGRGGWGIAAAAGRLSKSHGQVGQKACFQRIRSFVVACFSRKEEFPLPPGRFGPDLVARLLELEAFAGAFENLGSSTASDLLANLGLSLACRPVPSQLQPYRSLDVSRLRLHGTGAWQIAPFLEGSLWLPFLEPGILRHGLPLGSKDLPDFEKEDAEEHLKLALLWDARTLLHLVPPLPIGERSCRIFNSYKSAEADRQIGDRRPANRAELHLTGPSQWLPQGSLFAAYRLPRRKAQITAFVSDRCDFYHQIAVTEARAGCNRLPFAYPREAFQGTAALAAVEARLGPHDAGQVARSSLLNPSHLRASLPFPASGRSLGC